MTSCRGTLGKLSDRERQILELAALGRTDQAIGLELMISVGTVNTYWSRIRLKMGRLSRSELVTELAQDRAKVELDALRSENAQLLAALELLHVQESHARHDCERTEHLIRSAPDAMLVVDAAGSIRLANEASETLFEYERGSLAGRHLRDLVPSRFHGEHAQRRNAYLSHPEKRTMGGDAVTTGVTRGGREIAIVATISVCKTDEGALAVCIIRGSTGVALKPSK